MIIDIIVVIILLISAIIAFLRGLIREILTIAGVIGGMAAAYFGGPLLAPTMEGWLGVEEGVEPERLLGMIPYDVLASALSYGVIFIIVVIILSIISHFLAEGVRSLGLGAIDRTFGFIFGLLRGILILGLLNLPIYLFVQNDTTEKFTAESKTIFYVNKTSAFISKFMPDSTKENLDNSVSSMSENIGEKKGTFDQLNRLKEQHESMTAPRSTTPNNEGGYDQELRNQMDQLFQEKTEDR